MSNTNMDYLYPEFWAAAFDTMDKGNYGLQNLVSKNFSKDVANRGDTVNVPLTPSLTASDWTPGDDISADGISQTIAQLTLNQSKAVPINLTAKELSMSNYDLIESYGIPMAQAILEAVNVEIYKEALKSTYIINPGTPGTTGIDEDDVVDAGTLLDTNKIGQANRIFVGSPTDIGTLLKTDAFQRADAAGDGGRAMATGELGSKFGFRIFKNNAITDYTPADLSGAVVASGGSTAKVITVNGFADSTNPVRAGDIFKIAANSTYYSATATTQTGGNTTGINFAYNESGLVDIANAEDAVTVVSTRSALCFVPSAIAFAARQYAQLPQGAGVMSTVVDVDGLPVRISVWHDGKLGLTIQADILFGAKLVSQKRIVRILC